MICRIIGHKIHPLNPINTTECICNRCGKMVSFYGEKC